ncbi:alpha/beta hydrolase fold protein [Aquisphaera giovannonii]|uniref:Alpha/beta hydrolase fold protein n=1 Tax=Aquisphaera giovannonii TaxID=406548 RepID=A0A5B9WEV6_9BACT|nr:alpha/beta hydrolase [Aquisphaera giovannonii]QEH38585.1 alpha/beta hydrolase fold protein [Aquisphaera giovannonii]
MRAPGTAEKALIVGLVAAAIAVPRPPASRAGAVEDASEPAAAKHARSTPPPYPHAKVRRYDLGEGPRSYWIFEPAEPRPERAPVVVFLHGWFAVNPAFYGAWIDHLVRSGRTVVFPRYQNDVGTLPKDFLPNASAAIRDALDVLATGTGHVRPDFKDVAFIGHSAGGNLSAQLAALSSDAHSGVPEPRLVFALMPGEVLPAREPTLDRIPASTLLVVAVGEDDLLVGDIRGRQIFNEATSVPRSRKRYLLFRSDRHGYPPLLAEHAAPTGANDRLDTGEGLFRSFQMNLGSVNALDRAGFWRIADAALATASANQTFDDAIRDTDRFTHLGYWSDGRKVTPPLISDNPSSLPRVSLPNGIRLIPWSASARIDEASRETRVR